MKEDTNIIMISTDRKAFEEESDVRRRFSLYGSITDSLHIIVFAKKNTQFSKVQIADNVWLYPTNSSSVLCYIFDAIKIGKNIIYKSRKIKNKNWLITTQDPFETGIVGVILARKLDMRLDVQIHTDFFSPYFKKGNVKNRIRVCIGRLVLKKSDSIRVVSKRIKYSIETKIKGLKHKITVLPIFVDIKKIKETQIKTDLHKKYPQFSHISLIISRLEKEKDINRVLESFKYITKNNKKAGLILVGDGSERKHLELTVKHLNLEENVVFEGWQENQKEIISYYKTADLFINSSLYEGYGRTIVESLASGTPVLSTDVGVAQEVGADIFTTNKELTRKIGEYIVGKTWNSELKSYPYTNELAYLDALKNTWE